jgi:hypothetical protein
MGEPVVGSSTVMLITRESTHFGSEGTRDRDSSHGSAQCAREEYDKIAITLGYRLPEESTFTRRQRLFYGICLTSLSGFLTSSLISRDTLFSFGYLIVQVDVLLAVTGNEEDQRQCEQEPH